MSQLVGVGVVVLLAVFIVLLYNRLIAARNLALQGFADIDVQLKRRADLIPALVESVRVYAAHEKALLTTVTALRTEALQQKTQTPNRERFAVEQRVQQAVTQILVLQENFPHLKADENFRDLSAKLVDVENHLQYARRFYNGAVKQYVTRLASFPDLLIARLFNFQALPFFETDDRNAPRVQWEAS